MTLAVVAAGSLLGALAGCGSQSSTKAGGSAAPLTLTMGTNDGPGRPSSDAIEEFARQVEALSGGRLRIRPIWQAVGRDQQQWDQHVARRVVGGDLDLAMVPARAWDAEGVTGLRALQSPFLVTSDEHLDRVVTAPVAHDLLASLEGHGVVGLALVPEGLRHPFAFAAPLLRLADYAGTAIRAPYSKLSYAMLEALGAVPRDLIGPALDVAVESSEVGAAESEFVLASTIPSPSTATGNVTFYAKADTLVVNDGVFARLDDGQRDVLRRAAERTVRWAIDATPADGDAAAAYCAAGGTIVLADESDVAALRRAAAPVEAELERDPVTARLLGEIRALRPSAATAVRPCASPSAAAPAFEAARTPTPIDGVYRAELRRAELVDRGMAPNDASDNAGLVRLTFDRGALVIHEERDAWPDCHGLYAVHGEELQVLITGPGCPREERPLISRWSIASDALQLVAVDPADPFTRVWWGGEPFRRVAAVDAAASSIPDGSYRRIVGEDQLRAEHVPPDQARRRAGISTLTLDGDTFTLSTANDLDLPACRGSTTRDGARTTFLLDDCGGGVLLTAVVAFANDELRFRDVRAEDPAIAASFGGAPWARLR